MEVPSPARKSSLVVLLVKANLGSAGNLVETPREIFTLFSYIRSSTQLQNLRNDICTPYWLIWAQTCIVPSAIYYQSVQLGETAVQRMVRDGLPGILLAPSCAHPLHAHTTLASRC